jgi:hypothetical protein
MRRWKAFLLKKRLEQRLYHRLPLNWDIAATNPELCSMQAPSFSI